MGCLLSVTRADRERPTYPYMERCIVRWVCLGDAHRSFPVVTTDLGRPFFDHWRIHEYQTGRSGSTSEFHSTPIAVAMTGAKSERPGPSRGVRYGKAFVLP